MTAHTLSSIAAELESAGHPGRAHVLREVEELLRRFNKELETIVRTFVDASKILIDHDKQQTQHAADLQAQLTAALANALTPEVQAAQQAIIDAAAAAVPEAVPETPPTP